VTSALSDVIEDDSKIESDVKSQIQWHLGTSSIISLLNLHNKMQYSIALIVVAVLASVSAFTVNSKLSVAKVNSLRVRSSRFILAAAEDSEPEFQPEDPKLFDMNRIVRLGRSRDQVRTSPNVTMSSPRVQRRNTFSPLSTSTHRTANQISGPSSPRW
jgi:hypothetical protein